MQELQSLDVSLTDTLELSEETLTVLAIDDDATNLLVIDKILSPHNCNVVKASSGREALERLAEVNPDVILLDVMMPDLNCFDVCRTIKQNPQTRLIPVVIITALQEKRDRIAGIEAGCDDFISKPIDRHELIARVHALGKVKRLNDDLVHAEEV